MRHPSKGEGTTEESVIINIGLTKQNGIGTSVQDFIYEAPHYRVYFIWNHTTMYWDHSSGLKIRGTTQKVIGTTVQG